jgi:hypothetical protein
MSVHVRISKITTMVQPTSRELCSPGHLLLRLSRSICAAPDFFLSKSLDIRRRCNFRSPCRGEINIPSIISMSKTHF